MTVGESTVHKNHNHIMYIDRVISH